MKIRIALHSMATYYLFKMKYKWQNINQLGFDPNKSFFLLNNLEINHFWFWHWFIFYRILCLWLLLQPHHRFLSAMSPGILPRELWELSMLSLQCGQKHGIYWVKATVFLCRYVYWYMIYENSWINIDI